MIESTYSAISTLNVFPSILANVLLPIKEVIYSIMMATEISFLKLVQLF